MRSFSSARRSGPTEWEIFLRVLGSTEDLRGTDLEIWENGEKTHTETIEVSLEEAERMVIPVSADKARFVEARLVPSGFDSMMTDNSVWLSLPAARPDHLDRAEAADVETSRGGAGKPGTGGERRRET